MTETICGDPHRITPISEKILSLYRYMLAVIYGNLNGFWVSDLCLHLCCCFTYSKLITAISITDSKKRTLCCIISIFHDKANFNLLHGPVTDTLQKRHKWNSVNISLCVCARIHYPQLPLYWIVLFNLENYILSQFVFPWMDASSSIR